MADTQPIGELEQLILLAILRLGPEAYGLSIARELESHAGRRLSRGALYTSLDRLETKGFLRWRLEPGGPERQALPKRVYSVLPSGVSRAALVAAHPPPDVAGARPRAQGAIVTRPPRFFDWLLRRSLPPGHDGDSIRGDLLEELAPAGQHSGRADFDSGSTSCPLLRSTAFRRAPQVATNHGDTRWKLSLRI